MAVYSFMRHLRFAVVIPLRFQRSRRLTDARQYQAVFKAKVKKIAGPLIVWGRTNELPHWRLGLSVGRRVGNAVVRNRAKRMVREAFRLLQHEFPLRETGEGRRGYDIVVSVRAHENLALDEYRKLLLDAAQGVHKEWEKRAARAAREDGV